jgi:hypothetical protein
MKSFCLAGCFAVLWTAAAQAARIDVGIHTLLPNTPNQIIELHLQPSNPVDQLLAFDLYAELPPASGPPFDPTRTPLPQAIAYWSIPPSNATGPVFSDFEFFGDGLVFGDVEYHTRLLVPRAVFGSLLAPLETSMTGSGLLARLVVDTTGVYGEVDRDLMFPLRLYRTGWANTDLINNQGSSLFYGGNGLTDGFVRIAALPNPPSNPEPSSVVLALLGGFAFLAMGIKRSCRQ